MLKSDLDTPALILDLDLFEENLKKMRDYAASYGKKLRPHAKTHKCPEIARRQLAMGNCAGICAAKLSEAQALAQAGIQDILITSPVTAPWKIRKAAALNQQISGLQLTVDNPEQVKMLARAAGSKAIHVVIDVDPEMGRTGIPPKLCRQGVDGVFDTAQQVVQIGFIIADQVGNTVDDLRQHHEQ